MPIQQSPYVPYRLIRPFYSEKLEEVRKEYGRKFESVVNRYVRKFNSEDVAGAPYRFSDDGKGIEIDSGWAHYFSDNRHVIRGWIESKLISYLQARNASVPAIPLKIYAPEARNLATARKYWEEALNDHVFRDIYSGVPFDKAGYETYGPMGVDHFIPWSFVLHDEPWNLAPMFRDVNSSKGNKLPILDKFLHPFCEQQFDALMTLRNTGRHKKIFESYAQIDADVMHYEQNEAALVSFTDSVSKVVVPLHQIAANQGFPTWRPQMEYGTVWI